MKREDEKWSLVSLLKAERHEADMTESGKVFHRTTHDGIYDDKNLAVDEMGNSTVRSPTS